MKKVNVTNFLFLFFVLFSAGLYAQTDTVKLNLPADKAAGVSIEPTFKWFTDSNAVNYRLQIATAKTFALGTVVFNDTTLTDTTKTLSLPIERLDNSKQYFWRVLSKNSEGKWVDTSLVRTFYTVSAVTPALLYPVGGTTVYTSSVTLSWNSEPYSPGVKYDVYYSKSLSQGELYLPATLASNTTALTKNFPGLEAGTTYYWQVRAKTSTGVVASYSAIDSFATIGTAGAVVPEAAWPIGGTTVTTKDPTLYFFLNTMNPGLKFNVYYSTTPGFSTTGADSTGWKTAMNVKLTALTPGAHYYWKVRSRLISDSTKVSAPSEEADFVVDSSLAESAQVPVQSWPVGGATVYTTSVRFSWYLNSYVTGLKYQIKYQELPSGSETPSAWTSNSYVTIPNLTPGKSYLWWVKSTNDTISNLTGSGWSKADSFMVDSGMIPTAVVPILSWPVGEATVYSTTPTLYWYALSGASGLQYQVQYSTESDAWTDTNKTVTLAPTAKTSVEIPHALIAGGTYYWRVCSRVGSSGTFGDYSDPESFTVAAAAPVEALQPIISSPSEGAVVTKTSVNLTWYLQGSSAGLKYHLQVSNYPFDENYLIAEVDTLSNMSYLLPGLAPGATYAWRVRSYDSENPANKSVYSDVAMFTVSAGAGASLVPLSGSPIGGVKLYSVNPLLTWFMPAASSSVKYELQYSLKKDMSNSESLTGITSPSKSLNGLKPGVTYYWRVRSFNKDGKPSAFSSVESFVAASLTGVEKNSITPSKFEVAQNYPNPFNPSTTIKVSLPAASFLSVKIYNMLGQEVRTLISAQAQAGVHSVIWHGEDNSGSILPSGAYIYRVTAGKNVTSGKMMFLK